MVDKSACLEAAKKINPDAFLCDDAYCAVPARKNQTYAYCHCQPPYPPPPPNSPCTYGPNSPVPYPAPPDGLRICYCCCSCFAWETPIAVPGGEKRIQLFEVGDPVLAAGTDLNWTEVPVEFSDGVPPGDVNGKTVITLYYMRDKSLTSLVVTPDHVFLLASGKVTRAEFLVPGQDQLVEASTGNPVDILGMETGGFFGGLHHISTTETAAKSVDGHLLNSKGVVTGDWALQLSDLEKLQDGFDDRSAEATSFTAEYAAKHSHLESTAFSHRMPGVDLEAARPDKFVPYDQSDTGVPDFARHFVSEKQARDIQKNAQQAPVTSNAGQENVHYLFRLLNGFYRDINFRLEWERDLPNAYSWEQYGVKFVVLHGGLVRTEGVDLNTLAVILGHEVSHLVGGPPLTRDGRYSCEGQADYAAVAAVIPSAFYTHAREVTVPGVAGVKKLFDFIDPRNRKGKLGRTCEGISIRCREKALDAALMGGFLPECAGGPVIDWLEIQSATASCPKKGDKARVRVVFNQPVLPDSATLARNYTFSPKAKIGTVKVDPDDPACVLIRAALDKGGDYVLKAEDVLSTSYVGFDDGKARIDVDWIG